VRRASSGSGKPVAIVFAVALSIGLLAVLTVGALAHGTRDKSQKRTLHVVLSGRGGLKIRSRDWGTVPAHPPFNRDQQARLYRLSNGHRMTVTITNYGGVVQSIRVPDRRGHIANVALGFPTLSDYVNDFQNQPWPAAGGSGDTYFGAIIGRYANRIGFVPAHHHAGFTLDGKFYPTPENNGQNTLHGGPDAYNTQVWKATPVMHRHSVSLKLTYTDPGGYNGFPGRVRNTVVYTLTQGNALVIRYRARTNKPTVINLTNHTYFNLAGEGSGDVYGQLMKINANRFTPTDANLIPTGVLAPVAGTPFDFRSLKPIGRDIRHARAPRGRQLVLAHGYDHNWVLNGSGMKLAAVAVDPHSGRVLTTYTTQPGVQFYTGNFLVGDLVGTSGRTYRQSDGFTLETQHFPNSPNQPNFPSTRLNPGHTFRSTTIYKFSTTRHHRHR
jgi:aldose 1-epimerase